MTGELERRFHRLGPGIPQKDLFGTIPRRQSSQAFGQLDVALFVIVSAADMQQLSSLILDRLHDARMTVTGGADRDAGRAVKETVAVQIFNHRALGTFHRQRVCPRE